MNLEISQESTVISGVLGVLEIKPYQIVTSVRLLIAGQLSPEFPAILDTGFNHNFSIREDHLRLLGIQPESLETLCWMKVLGKLIPLKRADIHLGAETLSTVSGIAVWPGEQPRLPLVGMRALVQSGLRLVIDGRKKTGWIGQSRWYH